MKMEVSIVLLLFIAIPVCGCQSPRGDYSEVSGDVVVYGATPSGIMAAIEAARHVSRVTLLEPTQYLGGMATNGLGSSDQYYGDVSVGGLPALFYRLVDSHYGESKASQGGHNFEPHVAEQEFREMLAPFSNIAIYTGETLQSVQMTGTKIASLTATDGRVYSGSQFIDASYTGDLMAAAHVTYTVGRESSAHYGESFGGVGTPISVGDGTIDPYNIPNDPSSGLIPHVTADPLRAPGSDDKAVMAYNYRLCLSSDPANQIPFAMPAKYNPAEFEVNLRQFADQNSPTTLRDFIGLSTLPNNKYDMNASLPLSSDEPEISFSYPDATEIVRGVIDAEEKRYMQALLYFLSKDPRVPAAIHQQINALGLCKDEFKDNGGWPHQIYVRESRRMIGEYVFTQSDIEAQTSIPDPIGVGGYPMDDHINYLFNYYGHVNWERKEGLQAPQYPISYRILTPKTGEAANLLVTVDVSASHVAYDSLRVEATYMIMGQAAGAAAYLALRDGVPTQSIPYGDLSDLLTGEGVILTPK